MVVVSPDREERLGRRRHSMKEKVKQMTGHPNANDMAAARAFARSSVTG